MYRFFSARFFFPLCLLIFLCVCMCTPVVYRRCRFHRNREEKKKILGHVASTRNFVCIILFFFSVEEFSSGLLIYICVCLLFVIFSVFVGPKQPRKILLEQLVRCMPADDALPDHVVMVSGADLQGCNLAGRLAERQQRAVCTGGVADVRATIACLVSKIQKL